MLGCKMRVRVVRSEREEPRALEVRRLPASTQRQHLRHAGHHFVPSTEPRVEEVPSHISGLPERGVLLQPADYDGRARVWGGSSGWDSGDHEPPIPGQMVPSHPFFHPPLVSLTL